MHELDRQTLRELMRATEPKSQAELALSLEVPASTLAKALVRLENSGLVELPKSGRNKPPKLAVLAATDRLSEEVRKLMAATA